MTKNPLIGKILLYDTDNGACYGVSRFTSEVAEGYFLMRRIHPREYEDLPMSHVVNLRIIAGDENSEIFDSLDEFRDHMEAAGIGQIVQDEEEEKSHEKTVGRPSKAH